MRRHVVVVVVVPQLTSVQIHDIDSWQTVGCEATWALVWSDFVTTVSGLRVDVAMCWHRVAAVGCEQWIVGEAGF